MSSKKIISLQKKVREKINSIHEQKNILTALVDSFVLEADDQAERLLSEKDDQQFMVHYLDVMKLLDQSYNSCVMLTAEAECLCENFDTTVVELLPKADDVDEEDEMSLKGAMAAPRERLLQNNSRLPNKDSYSTRNVEEFPSAHVKMSAPTVPQQPILSTKLNSSTPVKSDMINSVESNQKNDNVENLIDHYSKPSTDKSVMNIPVVLESDVRDTERETKTKVESKHDRRKSSSKRGNPGLDKAAAARFLKGIIKQAEKDNESLHIKNTKQKVLKHREFDKLSTSVDKTMNVQESGDSAQASQNFEFSKSWNKEPKNQDGKVKSSVKTRDYQRNVSSGQTDDKNCLLSHEVEKHKLSTEQFEKTTVDSVVESLSHKIDVKSTETTEISSKKSGQNDLTFLNNKSSTSVNTTIPLEMNIATDSCEMTASSIGQMNLIVGRPTPVIVSETCSPWNFYVQVVDSALQKLMLEIRVFMESKEKYVGVVEKVEVGMVCLARFSQDELYYRAKITDIYPSGDPQVVNVLYIDYGNAEKRDITHLRQLPSMFAALPAQAIYCALAKIAPNNKYDVWSEQDMHNFSRVTHSKEFFCTLIKSSQHQEIPNIVDLFFNTTLPGSWAPTPVFIQTILMNSCVGRMVSIQEQLTSFMIFFQLSPKSDSTLSELSNNNISTVSVKAVDLSTMKQSHGERDSIARNTNNQDLPVRPKSDDSNDTCDVKESSTKQEEPISETNNCDKDKSVLVKEQSIVKCEGHTTDKVHKVGQNITASGFVTAEDEIKQKNMVSKTFEVYSDVEAKKKIESEKNDKDDTKCLRGKSHSRSTISEVKCDGRSTISEVKCDGRSTISEVKCDGRSTISEVKCDGEENSGIKNEGKSGSEEETRTKDEPKVLIVTHNDSAINSNDFENETDRNANFMEGIDVTVPIVDTQSTCFNVMVSFVKSFSHFYVHIISEVTANTLNVMSNNINSTFSQLSRKQLQKMSKRLSPQVNDICCAQFFEDNNYYRAQILEIQAPSSNPEVPSEDSDSEKCGKAQVFYMDYGDVEWVPKRKLFPLPKELKDIPPLAIKCCLAYIKPVVKDDQNWSKDVNGCFNKLIGDGQDKILKMIIIDGSIEKMLESINSDPLKVILVDVSEKEEICINMDLIRQGFAVLGVKEEVQSQMEKEKIGDWDPMMEDYFSARNSYKIDVDDAGVATVGYKARDESRICKFYNLSDCWRGDRCPYRHVQMSADGITQDQELVYGAVDDYYMDKLLPDPGIWLAVEVTTILNPGHFYVSLPFGKTPTDDLKEKEESGTKESEEWQMNFEELISEMQEEYNKVNHNEDNTVDKAPGEIVAAKYTPDGKWYRARVLIVEESRMRVFFVDFGNRDWIRYESIRTILPDFLHLPFQAIECFLLGIEPLGARYSTESKQRFKELVDGKILISFVKTRSYNGIIWIDLYDTTGQDDIDIAKVLSSEKLVQDTGSTSTTTTGSSKLSRCSSQTSLVLVPG